MGLTSAERASVTQQQWIFTAATVALLVSGLVGAKPSLRSERPHPSILAGGALFLVAVLVRLLYVRPTLVHADMLGPAILDSFLDFPAEAQFKSSYGRYGFFAVGALARLFGRDAEALFLAMSFVGMASVLLLGVLAARLVGSPHAFLLGIAMAGFHPAMMRVAASEDMHNVGLLLGLVALLTMDQYATHRRIASLLASVIALGLLMHTRQTFYLFAPFAFVIALFRAGPRLLRDLDFWAAGLAVVLVLVPRALATQRYEGSALPAILFVLGSADAAPDLFRHHVVFDVGRYGLLPMVSVASLLLAPFGPRVLRGYTLLFLAYFVATYPCGFPSPGVELAQRLPTLAIALLITSAMGAHLLEQRCPQALRARAGWVLAGLIVANLALSPGLRLVRERTPDYLEYEAVAAQLDALPEAFTLVILPSVGIMDGYSRYAGMLRRAGKQVEVVLPDARRAAPEPQIFLEGVACWTYTFRELTGIEDEIRDRDQLPLRFDRVLFGRQVSSLRPPPRMRPECAELLDGSVPLGRSAVVRHPVDDPPFLFYATDSLPVRFHALRAPSDTPGQPRSAP